MHKKISINTERKTVMLTNVIVDTFENAMVYVPRYVIPSPSGIKINSKVSIPVVLSNRKRHVANQKTVIAHGKMADMLAKHLNEGKMMSFVCDLDYNIKQYAFGPDCATTVYRETYGYKDEKDKHRTGMSSGEGYRPIFWNKSDHVDGKTWQQILDARRRRVFLPSDERNGKFGFAEVKLPEGDIIILYGN